MKRTVLYIIFLSINIGFCQYRQKAGQPYAEPDLLIWENDTIQIQTFPLYCLSTFDQKNLFDNKEAKPECWGCLKNYIAEWKIINSKLYLSNIYSFNFKKDSIKTDLNKLFPDKIKNNVVLADWYSGNLFVPKGEHIWMSQSPGFPIYESEWKLIIEKGQIENMELKNGNYYKSIYTESPKNLIAFIENNLDQKSINELKNRKISIYLKTGKSKNDFSISKVKGITDKSLEKKLVEVINKLPNFDYYYRHGEELNIIFLITFMDNRP
ncbi:hypothetical protein D1816_02215 [Aquimarina sp. AD10]|uniref:hypothetical protein n=1 Tax=Aquimarina sp. AD10 TaxID=1714849 RepID=UPI000E4DDD17|nr:hypothetical protein [Aquimarina sp. AD10]AXT59209.1 hypothetical protein D1816_02215 [Aquimarina sp. AD10]RKM92699.1 hypothetical protein D7033_20790 [Aquimarina sp. AD10]